MLLYSFGLLPGKKDIQKELTEFKGDFEASMLDSCDSVDKN